MAAQTVIAKIGGSSNLIEIDETLIVGVATPVVPSYLSPAWNYVTGTSGTANAINQWWEPASSPITLSSSASVTYTLSALTDNLGRTISFAGGVRGFGIIVISRTAGDYLTVGNAASHAWVAWGGGTTPTFTVWDFHCSMVQKTDAFAVVASTTDQLKIVNSGSNSITFRIMFWGCLT